MTVKLYALKCENGYIKSLDNAYELVSLARASVFAKASHPALLELQGRIERNNKLENLRIVELIIEESDFTGAD